jgi:hypothetical protein
MAYTTIDDPSQHFDILTRSGVYDSSGTYDLTGLNFQPDFVWEKVRSVSGDHYLQNSSLTGKKMLKSNSNAAENTDGNIESYLSNGIQINRQYDWNSSRTLVDWFWKANGGTTTNGGSDDTVSTSTHQANTTAGFSIVTYSGTGTQGHTVAHGLGVAPEVIFLKARNKSQNWRVFHHKTASDGTKRLILDQTNAQEDAAFLNDTAPSSTVFTLGASDDAWNASDGTYVAYCFAPIKGYSKFGSYTGNGNADGSFIYTGFKPAWIMLKRTDSTNNWNIFDSKRDVDNQVGNVLYANLNNAEEADASHSSANDFLSNGFKLRETGNAVNGSGASYIYMAFAEHPFVSSKGVPVMAR